MPDIQTEERRKTAAERILEAARGLFLAHGFSGATTDMIQRKAGVSKATVYACYPNKEALFEAVIAQACAELMARFDAIVPVPGQIEATLTNIGRTYLDIALSPTGLALYRTVVAEAPRFPHLARTFFLAAPRVSAARVADQLMRAASSGELDLQSIGVEAGATVFIGLLRGEAQMECLTHPDAQPSAARVDEWVRLAVITFLRAYGQSAPLTASLQPSVS